MIKTDEYTTCQYALRAEIEQLQTELALLRKVEEVGEIMWSDAICHRCNARECRGCSAHDFKQALSEYQSWKGGREMRKIKFRVWDKELKEMCSVTDIQLWINYVHYSQKDGDIGKGNYPADVVLMQYTGLKDKNGNEIYEGDIVEDILTAEKQVVEFHGNAFTLVGYKSRFFFTVFRSDEKQIIGNIYDNPELLEGKR